MLVHPARAHAIVISIFIAARHFTSQAVKNKGCSVDLLVLQVSWQPLMLTSPVKDIQGYCFYSGLFDPSFPCPCRAKLAGQRSLWWSDMAFLPERSLGPVYLYACLKEPRGYTQTLHTLRKMSLSCLIINKLSGGKKKNTTSARSSLKSVHTHLNIGKKKYMGTVY